MKKSLPKQSERGFSLIELLIVVTIVGILAAISVAFYSRARVGAENRSAIALLSTLRSSQTSYYAQRGRYARLDELNVSQNNAAANGSLGNVTSPTMIRRGKFTFEITTITDDELRTNYQIVATRDNDTPLPYIFTLDETGVIDNMNSY
jgi:prepilin-type N-terminal cleavage/methylation domain-containing protein